MCAKVLIVGAVNADFVVKAERMPKLGESLYGQDFRIVPGGKGGNQAVAVARLGGKAAFVGRVGNDSFGEMLLESLGEKGVDTRWVFQDPAVHTGIALIVVAESGENSILVVRGANHNWSKEDVGKACQLVSSYDLVLLGLEVPLKVTAAVANAARKAGITTVLDAGPAQPCPEGYLSRFDVVSPNETEAEALTGIRVADLNSAGQAGEVLLKIGAKVALLKLGDKGSLIVTPGGKVHIPAIRIPVADTTAAGDAYTAAFALKYASGNCLEEAAKYASYAGAAAVTKFGAQPSMPTKEEVKRLMAKHL